MEGATYMDVMYKLLFLLLFFQLTFITPPLFGADDDGDGIDSSLDNCPATVNAGQEDRDADHVGDLCDADQDGDGLTDLYEEEIRGTDPENWDTDGEGISDLYDCEPLDPNNSLGIDCDIYVFQDIPSRPVNPAETENPNGDDDRDGVTNQGDNCPMVFNPGQQDQDRDGIGDQCDSSTQEALPPETDSLLAGSIHGASGCSLIR